MESEKVHILGCHLAPGLKVSNSIPPIRWISLLRCPNVILFHPAPLQKSPLSIFSSKNLWFSFERCHIIETFKSSLAAKIWHHTDPHKVKGGFTILTHCQASIFKASSLGQPLVQNSAFERKRRKPTAPRHLKHCFPLYFVDFLMVPHWFEVQK